MFFWLSFPSHGQSVPLATLDSELGDYAETVAVLVLGIFQLKCKLMMTRPGCNEYKRFQEDSNPHVWGYKIDDLCSTLMSCV